MWRPNSIWLWVTRTVNRRWWRLADQLRRMPATKKRELDLSEFPPGTITEYTTLVCLACIFDIFTKQLGLAPRTAFTEVKRHTPTIAELTSRGTTRPYFDSEEKR